MGLWGGLQEWRVAPGGRPARKQGLQSSNDKENSASSWVSVDCPSRAQPGPQMGTEHHVPSHPTHEPRAKAAETVALAAGS